MVLSPQVNCALELSTSESTHEQFHWVGCSSSFMGEEEKAFLTHLLYIMHNFIRPLFISSPGHIFSISRSPATLALQVFPPFDHFGDPFVCLN